MRAAARARSCRPRRPSRSPQPHAGFDRRIVGGAWCPYILPKARRAQHEAPESIAARVTATRCLWRRPIRPRVATLFAHDFPSSTLHRASVDSRARWVVPATVPACSPAADRRRPSSARARGISGSSSARPGPPPRLASRATRAHSRRHKVKQVIMPLAPKAAQGLQRAAQRALPMSSAISCSRGGDASEAVELR